MDLELLALKMDDYLKKVGLEYTCEVIKNGNLKYARGAVEAALKPLDNEEIQIVIIGYENGTSQVCFNLGQCNECEELIMDAYSFNLGSFGLKCVVEYDELRFYNQAFYQTPDEMLNNADKIIGMFCREESFKVVRGFLKYLKK